MLSKSKLEQVVQPRAVLFMEQSLSEHTCDLVLTAWKHLKANACIPAWLVMAVG